MPPENRIQKKHPTPNFPVQFRSFHFLSAGDLSGFSPFRRSLTSSIKAPREDIHPHIPAWREKCGGKACRAFGGYLSKQGKGEVRLKSPIELIASLLDLRLKGRGGRAERYKSHTFPIRTTDRDLSRRASEVK